MRDPSLETQFTQAELRSHRTQFESIQSGADVLTPEHMKSNFSKLGFEKPLDDEDIANLLHDFDTEKTGLFNFEAFLRLQLDLDNSSSRYSPKASPRKSAAKRAFMRSSISTAVHTFNESEVRAYVAHINSFLANDRHLGKALPIDPHTDQLFELVKKGVLLCKLINVAVPGTIDERAINVKENPNPWERVENHTLFLNSAKAIGCSVVNIGTEDLAEGKPHLFFGLIAQIVKIQLLGPVNVKATPELTELWADHESFEDLTSLSSESLLLRWMNHHLKKTGYKKPISNFSTDVKDGEAYCYLLHQLAPEKCDLSPLEVEGDERALRFKSQAEKLGCWQYLQGNNSLEGSANLNVAFVASVFKTRNGLVLDEAKLYRAGLLEGSEEITHEMKALSSWITSLGVDYQGGSLIQAVKDGAVLLHILEKLRPGCIQKDRTPNKSPLKAHFLKLERCIQAVQIGKEMNLSTVGIAGEDLAAGNKTLILGFLWQLMRYHMLQLLKNLQQNHEISEAGILKWANEKVQAVGKVSKMGSFKDKSLSNGIFFLDLLGAVDSRVVDFSLVTKGLSGEEKKKNAHYIISVARKLGCSIFLAADDIIEVRPRMVMMLTASIMQYDLLPKRGENTNETVIGSPKRPSNFGGTNGSSSSDGLSTPKGKVGQGGSFSTPLKDNSSYLGKSKLGASVTP